MLTIKINKWIRQLTVAKKIAVIVALMIFVRAGSVIPIPFVNADYMKNLMDTDGLGFFNMVTGGSMSQMSLFALSISPYISASIVMQLMTVCIPSLEEMQREGKTGQDRFKKITNVAGVVLALMQSVAMAVGFGSHGLLDPYNVWTVLAASVIWTVGAAVLILLGEWIEKLGIGSGISIILLCNILSSFPEDAVSLYTMFLKGQKPAFVTVRAIIIAAVLFAVVFCCAWLTVTERRIPLIFSRKTDGTAGPQFLPVPLLACSVMPIIFAGSLMSMPVLAAQFIPALKNGVVGSVISAFSTGSWFNIERPIYSLGAVLYFVLSTVFTYFYLDIGMNPAEIAYNLKQQGAAVPGIRPGGQTEEYIRWETRRVAVFGNTLLSLMILLSYAALNNIGIGSLSLGGTSAIISVNVILSMKDKISTELIAEKKYRARRRKPLFAFSDSTRAKASV